MCSFAILRFKSFLIFIFGYTSSLQGKQLNRFNNS